MVKCSVLFEVRTEYLKYYEDQSRLQSLNVNQSLSLECYSDNAHSQASATLA
jgi:hypothetical protein